MPGGGDGAANRAASPDEEWWVPHSIALARQHAQEAARHAPAPSQWPAQVRRPLSQKMLPNARAKAREALPPLRPRVAQEVPPMGRALGESVLHHSPSPVPCAPRALTSATPRNAPSPLFM
jgi:hypothetical protein